MIARFNKERLADMTKGRKLCYVAEQIGIGRPLLSAYLNGTQPPYTNLIKIKNFFNSETGLSLTTDDWLVVEPDPPRKKKIGAAGRNRRLVRVSAIVR